MIPSDAWLIYDNFRKTHADFELYTHTGNLDDTQHSVCWNCMKVKDLPLNVVENFIESKLVNYNVEDFYDYTGFRWSENHPLKERFVKTSEDIHVCSDGTYGLLIVYLRELEKKGIEGVNHD